MSQDDSASSLYDDPDFRRRRAIGEILRRRQQGGGPGPQTQWIMVGLFVFLGLAFWGVELVIMVGLAILLHELGHATAMILFQYRNVRILFLPLVGGLASGVPTGRPNPWKEVAVSLVGPVVGLFFSLVAALLADRYPPAAEFAIINFVINAFNLLPLMPLDGGRALHSALFNRYPWLDIGFRALGVIGLGALALQLHSVVLLVLSLFLGIGSIRAWKVGQAVQRIRGKRPAAQSRAEPPEADETESASPEAWMPTILNEADRISPKTATNPLLHAHVVSEVVERLRQPVPPTGSALALVALYLAVALGYTPLIAGFMLTRLDPGQIPGMPTQQTEQSAPASQPAEESEPEV